jgi:hypothetical protein
MRLECRGAMGIDGPGGSAAVENGRWNQRLHGCWRGGSCRGRPQRNRFKPGDRVINAYFPCWIDGRPAPWKTGNSPGAQAGSKIALVAASSPAYLSRKSSSPSIGMVDARFDYLDRG